MRGPGPSRSRRDRRFPALGEYARYRTVLSSREQEMVVLAISRGNGYTSTHHLPSALKVGITQREPESDFKPRREAAGVSNTSV